MKQLQLTDLIDMLKHLKPESEVRFGFGEGASDCDRISFAQRTNTTVGAMLEAAENAIGLRTTWRHGQYPINGDAFVTLATEGHTRVALTDELLRAMTLNRLWKE